MTDQNPNTGRNNDIVSLQPNEMPNNFRYYTGIDWRALIFRLLENIHWILLSAVICGVAAGLYVKIAVTPIYQTTSKLYIAGSETTISLSDIQLGSSLAKDYQEVFKIWHVHEMVDERLGLNYSYSKLSGMVSVSNPDGSHLLYIRVQSPDPEEAKLLADTYAEVVQEFITEKMELRKPQLLELAQLPVRPVSPNIKSSILKAFLAGALVSMAIIAFLYLIDDKIRTEEDIEKVAGLATLGVVTKQSEKKDTVSAEDILANKSESNGAEIRKDLSLTFAGNEAFNKICSGIMFAGKNMKRIAVTSHEANNGKTFISIRIAYAMAKRGKKVLLIDADLRNSALIRQYKITHTDMGLAHFLSGQCALPEAVYPTNLQNLYLLPIGQIVKTPLPLLTSPDFEHMMEVCGQKFDVVIVDTPPVGAVIDAAEIARHCDGSILVLEYNKITRSSLRYMQRTMEQTKTPVIGCVLNHVVMKGLHPKQYYYYQYSNYSYYAYGDESGSKRGHLKHSAERNRDKNEP